MNQKKRMLAYFMAAMITVGAAGGHFHPAYGMEEKAQENISFDVETNGADSSSQENGNDTSQEKVNPEEEDKTEKPEDPDTTEETAMEVSKQLVLPKEEAVPITNPTPYMVTEDAPGRIDTTLRFDYPQEFSAIQKQEIELTLMDGTGANLIQTMLNVRSATQTIDGYTVSTTAFGETGEALDMLPNEEYAASYKISISGLRPGNYKIGLQGNGYKKYLSPIITIDSYSRHLVIGTSDDTFTIGDVNQDGAINSTDLSLVAALLGRTDSESLAKCDLNKDGKIDVLDIAYVNHQIGAQGKEYLFETGFILLSEMKIDGSKFVLEEDADISDLFKDTSSIKLAAPSGMQTVEIPIEFDNTVEMEQIEIVSPQIEGAVIGGTVMIEDADGKIKTVPFDQSQSNLRGIYHTEAETGVTKVTIKLGSRVAVKKITIQVTKVQDQETGAVKYAVVQQIRFLKDIVPDNLSPINTAVKNLKAVSGNESVTLTWNAVPNVTGYLVKYGTESKNYTKSMQVDTTTAVVSGLKNLTEYFFVVIPVNGSWTGSTSPEVSAIPQPSSVPKAPDMLKVQAMDGALLLSWNKADNATYYKVYYREKLEGQKFILADATVEDGKISDTKKTVAGLKNGVEYELYVISGNSMGESNPSITVVQKPEINIAEKPEGIPEGNLPREAISAISMQNPNNVLVSEYPNGFDVENVIDGNYATHWTARAHWESHAFNVTFTEPVEMNYVIYVPRLDGNYRKSLDTYTISVDDGSGQFVAIASGKVRNTPATTGYAILPFPVTTVKRIQVSCAQWAGSPTGVSMSELLFYPYDPDKDINGKITALFANDSFTSLKSSVTMDQIDALSAQLNENGDYLYDKAILEDELKLAKNLLAGDQSALEVVLEGIGSRSGLQPLGVSAKSGNSVTVYADIPSGEKVSVVATQYFAEAASWQQTVIAELEPGRNTFKAPQINSLNAAHGGPLYYTYQGAKGADITLQVRMATKIPTLELAEWYSLDQASRRSLIEAYIGTLRAYNQAGNENVLNTTEISMPNVLLSIPADAAKKALPADDTQATDMLYQNVEAWEEFMHIAKYTQGISETLEQSDPYGGRQNIRYMRMFGSAFMYAAGNHVGIGYGSCGGTLKGAPVSMMESGATTNQLFGWGLGHEVGHNMDKLGKAEITNNIYSLMIQTYDGNDNTLPSRLETSGKYKEIFDKTSLGAKGGANNVFVQLGMYWQLHLAYDEGKATGDPMGFYHAFFQAWKNGAASEMKNYDDRVAVVASQTANRNLTEFFTRWGMDLSAEAKAKMASYPAESRAIWYLSDESRRFRLSGGGDAVSGITPTVQAVANEKEVTLTISGVSNMDNIIGFEILRNGVPIAFTDQVTYTDKIGSANNLAFRYTVKAIDKLGNISSESAASEIRISYVKTIDPASYQMTVTGDVATVVFPKATAVTGFQLTGTGFTGSYTVQVKGDGETEYKTAKTGDYSNNLSETPAQSFLNYFTKPGALPTDTRMWTFNAKELKITGFPSGATLGLIDYPGDNIAFHEKAMVGRLGADYTYGDKPDDVIQKGTLIITGTYRGNPVYNTVEIQGRFSKTEGEQVEEEEEEEEEEKPEAKVEERPVDGYALLFAEVPKDGATSDISDGIFIFVPNIQKEAELQGKDWSSCDSDSLFPAMIKAALYIKDDPNDDTSSGRLSSDTIWVSFPADSSMPEIILE